MNYLFYVKSEATSVPCEQTFDVPGSGQVLVAVAQSSAAQLSQVCASEGLWTQTYPMTGICIHLAWV